VSFVNRRGKRTMSEGSNRIVAAAESSMMAIMKIPTVIYGVREAKIIAAKPEAKSTAFRRIPFPGRATVQRRASCTSFLSPYLCRKRLTKGVGKVAGHPPGEGGKAG